MSCPDSIPSIATEDTAQLSAFAHTAATSGGLITSSAITTAEIVGEKFTAFPIYTDGTASMVSSALAERALRGLNASTTAGPGNTFPVSSGARTVQSAVGLESGKSFYIVSKAGSASGASDNQDPESKSEEAVEGGEGRLEFEAMAAYDGRPDRKGFANAQRHTKGHDRVYVGTIFILVGEGDLQVYHVKIGCPFECDGEFCVSGVTGVNEVKQNRCGNEQLARRREMERVVNDFNRDGNLGPVIAISSGGSEIEEVGEDVADSESQ